ncbi:MAG: glycosyltransferase [Acidobacteriota bacterium]
MPEVRDVHHHVLLRMRGGAVRVARMLMTHHGGGWESGLSFEIDDCGSACDADPQYHSDSMCAAGGVGGHEPGASLVHVHGTQDWPGLLAGFGAPSRPFLITVHDCSLITGGCVYPVFCSHHARACEDPCPREYPKSEMNRALKRRAVIASRPVLVSPSSWLAGMLRQEWPGATVRVIPNGVDLPRRNMSKVEARSRFGITPEARVVLFLAHGGAHAAYKGGDLVESLLARIAGMVPGTLGIVAGGAGGERREGLLTLPYVGGEQLEALLFAADVLVYPSLSDNHPLVVLEAMAHGLPVAAYAVGGIPEQIEHGKQGMLVPVLAEDKLAKAVAAILNDSSLARAMSDSSRDRAARHFTSARMARDYEKLYERMMQPKD